MQELATHPDPWWQQALAGPLSVRLMILTLALLLGMAICARILWRLRPQQVATAHDDNGTATLEFSLVFPVLLFLALCLIQTTLLFGGQLIVHYAAFAATRTAIVQIPADYDAIEPANTLFHGGDNGKYGRIRQAAIVAVLPVSGRSTEGSVRTDELVQGLSDYFAAYGQGQPNWIEQLLPDRLRYAADDENTIVQVYHTFTDGSGGVDYEAVPDGSQATFGSRDAITVTVRHRFNLSIPIAREIFADGSNQISGGGGRYTEIEARYTLTNEGVIETLPPEPDLIRRP